MRRRHIILIAVMISLAFANGVHAQSIKSKMKGSVIICEYNPGARQNSCWIGCSLILSDGKEYDLSAKRISGKGSVMFSASTGFGRQAESYIVTLWEDRVNNCGCSFCRQNGYHLDGRLDTSTGSIDSAPVYISWKQLGNAIKFLRGKNVLLELPKSIKIKGRSDEEAQRDVCNRLSALIEVAAGLAGLPGTGGLPPVCSFSANSGRNQSVADFDIAFLRSREGTYYGLRASGVWGNVIADGMISMGFVKAGSREFVYTF
jgi:hypothetical protein